MPTPPWSAALRRVSVEHGYDPRRFTLVPFGGAGPLHACDLADALGIGRILIPPIPGVLSAYGMLVADIATDASQSVLAPASHLMSDVSAFADDLRCLVRTGRDHARRGGRATPRLDVALDMRYRGQSYELTVPLASPYHARKPCTGSVGAFHAAHEQRYGYAIARRTGRGGESARTRRGAGRAARPAERPTSR